MSSRKKLLVTHTFKGARFSDHALDLDVLPELMAYKAILVETAKELWRRENPDRRRLPNHFEAALSLKFSEVRAGSATVPLWREVDVPEPVGLWQDERDELDEAVELITRTLSAAASHQPLPEELPKHVLALFRPYGKTLRPGESIEHTLPQSTLTATYTTEARLRFQDILEGPYEDSVDILGTVTMVRVNRPRMAFTLDSEQEIEAPFAPEQEEAITSALKQHASAKIRLQGRGVFSGDGRLQRLAAIDRIDLLPTGEVVFDPGAKPIWEVFDDILQEIPAEELAALPADAAEQHDHYLYGTAKRA